MTYPQGAHQQQAPTRAPVGQSRFGALAWTASILGVVGLVGSPITFFNNLTAIIAGVGLVLGVIALFGTRKTLAAIGVTLCVLALVATVTAQTATAGRLDGADKAAFVGQA